MKSRGRLPAQIVDLALYKFDRVFGSFQIHLFLEFAGRLDIALLGRALECAAERVPILRGRLAFGIAGPYWRLQEHLDPATVVSVVKVKDKKIRAEMTTEFIEQGLDVRAEAPIRVLVLRSVGGDRAVVKLAHSIVDGDAALALIAEVHYCYVKLAADPAWRPSGSLPSNQSESV